MTIEIDCILFHALVLMAFFMAIDASVESNLTIDPKGPVLVLNATRPSDPHFEPIIVTCKSTGNYNITWDVPHLDFAELSDHEVLYVLSIWLNCRI